ncbi:hypothetical protein COX24_01395 [bacterium (Candidatus Gribaldobacteria) CG23_combo_of_CG06-09_8_20_14_all_37_87_8]|uniref:Uncharacterized protein n=2 Tax=Bacteria candidate phyla TaxID=1783234 RepID=A0A2H0TLV3_9BACT|nr:MAG: hypothetical protein COX24_01395 [bacterium (Candidatus Gribaldobacteria) CG23_combo_of_CG06-09_8_20_14_all_37_87_8]PIR73134.1 MAG: hypothetical protein COV26_00080 [Candidatus Nealsonbacteria bacterium CG10_big_fil_rev_8_21_14_0_10_36_23]
MRNFFLIIVFSVFFFVFSPMFCWGKEDKFMPHFYIPKKIIFSDTDFKTLTDLLTRERGEERLAVFFRQEGLFERIKKTVDEIYLKGVAKIDFTKEVPLPVVSSSFSQCKNGWFDDYLLFFALQKEKIEKETIQDNSRLLDKCLLFASKRIFEMKSCRDLKERINNYEENMNCALTQLSQLKGTEEQEYFSSWTKVRQALFDHQISVYKTEEIEGDDREKMKNLFRQLEERLNGLWKSFDFSKIAYRFDAPEAGEYKIYLENVWPSKGGSKEEKWLFLESNQFVKGENFYSVPAYDYGKNFLDDSMRILDYFPNTIYRISFEYKSFDGDPFFMINEGEKGKLFTVSLPTATEEKKYETYFRSSGDADKAFIVFSAQEVRNLRIERIRESKLVAIKTEPENFLEKVPEIAFIKVNPTKYRIQLSSVDLPFVLVFSENYHLGWKLYINKVQSDYREIVASYFNGEIKEGTHKNIFLDRSTFETWGKKTVFEDTHFPINFYTNSWYILPEKFDNQKKIELILEFFPQRLFYLGVFLSLIGITSSFIYSVVKKKFD